MESQEQERASLEERLRRLAALKQQLADQQRQRSRPSNQSGQLSQPPPPALSAPSATSAPQPPIVAPSASVVPSLPAAGSAAADHSAQHPPAASAATATATSTLDAASPPFVPAAPFAFDYSVLKPPPCPAAAPPPSSRPPLAAEDGQRLEIPCLKWPECPFAGRCRFWHPPVPCRFGKVCPRRETGCVFSHEPPEVAPVRPDGPLSSDDVTGLLRRFPRQTQELQVLLGMLQRQLLRPSNSRPQAPADDNQRELVRLGGGACYGPPYPLSFGQGRFAFWLPRFGLADLLKACGLPGLPELPLAQAEPELAANDRFRLFKEEILPPPQPKTPGATAGYRLMLACVRAPQLKPQPQPHRPGLGSNPSQRRRAANSIFSLRGPPASAVGGPEGSSDEDDHDDPAASGAGGFAGDAAAEHPAQRPAGFGYRGKQRPRIERVVFVDAEAREYRGHAGNPYLVDPADLQQKLLRARRGLWSSNRATVRLEAPSIEVENAGFRILRQMGWSSGKGLGRQEQGLTKPLSVIYRSDAKAGI